MTDPQVVFVVPDKMGGMMNIVESLLAFREPDGFRYNVVLTHNRLSTDTRFTGRLKADRQATVEYALPVENLYSALARLRLAIPGGGGVLVSNDLLELAMLHVHDPGMMVVQILHGDHEYYYDLAVRHAEVIDVFAAYSRTMFAELRRRLPQDRTDDVLYLPYGIAAPVRIRRAHDGPLRLVYAGRLEHGQKGIFDLPSIDAELERRHVAVEWTIIGGGPHERALRDRWTSSHVTWRAACAHEEVLQALPDFDVFVLPTRKEGFPVALVEAMACGVVPVVSDIASGVPEVVDHGRTGMRPPVADTGAFADAIAALAADRRILERMSAAASRQIAEAFDPRQRTRAYQQLFGEWRTRRRTRRPSSVPYGSRLDQPWIPNPVVRTVRSVVRQLQGKRW